MCLPLIGLAVVGIVNAVASIGGALAGAASGIAAGTGVAAGATAGAGAAVSGVSLGVGSLASTLGISVGSLMGGIGSLALAGASTGVSLAQQKKSVEAQSESIEKQALFESQKAGLETEQQRKSAGAQMERLAIEGARRTGYAQVSGLSPAQVARYAREARAATLRDVSSVQQQYEFGRQSSLLEARARQVNVGTRYKEIKSNLPGAGALALGISSDVLNQGLKLRTAALEEQALAQQTP